MGHFLSTKVIALGSCAFRQPRATSHCAKNHGYRLKAKFWFRAAYLDENHWVIDFGSLKDLKQLLENRFDHKTVIAGDDPELETFKQLHEKKIVDLVVFDEGVGIEMFAKCCFDLGDAFAKERTDGRCWVEKVEVFEHEDNSAIYERAS